MEEQCYRQEVFKKIDSRVNNLNKVPVGVSISFNQFAMLNRAQID